MASTKRGSKPDFHGAAGGEQARELYEHFVTKVQEMYEKEKVKNGVFQAMMQGLCYQSSYWIPQSLTMFLSQSSERWTCECELRESRRRGH